LKEKKMKKEVTLKKISENDFKRLHSIVYQGESPEWKKWDGPYFDDYKFTDYENFLKDKADFFKSDNIKGIYIDGILMGTVSRYWEDTKTRWLEVGIVIYDSNYWYGGYGNAVVINHGAYTSVYGHNSSVSVRVGQFVRKGQRISSAGSTGWSTGSHLHFEVRNSAGTPISPAPFIGVA